MQMVNERVVEWGNVWYTLPQGIMLIFVFFVLVFGYFLGFYFGMKLEKELESLRSKIKADEETALQEQGKFEKLYNDLKDQSSSWKKDSDEYQELVSSKKSELLEQLPEDDREMFKDLKLSQLERMVSKVASKPEAPKIIHGATNAANVNKNYEDMTEAERKQWHETTPVSYTHLTLPTKA